MRNLQRKGRNSTYIKTLRETEDIACTGIRQLSVRFQIWYYNHTIDLLYLIQDISNKKQITKIIYLR